MAQRKELAKTYEPREVEERLYRFWEEGGYFHAEVNPDKKPYTIVMPPPTSPGSCTWDMRSTKPFRIF